MSAERLNNVGGEAAAEAPQERPEAAAPNQPGSRRGSVNAERAPEAPANRRGSVNAERAPEAPGSRRGSPNAEGAPAVAEVAPEAPGSRRGSVNAERAPEAPGSRRGSVNAPEAPGSRRGSVNAPEAPGSRRGSVNAPEAPGSRRGSPNAEGAPADAEAAPEAAGSRRASAGSRASGAPAGSGGPSVGSAIAGSARGSDDWPPTDPHTVEFSYYCAVLRTYAPSLSREYDKMTTRLWMKKLFGPEYHPTVLKPKRNKYLLYLSITIYNDESYGIFKHEPPYGKLPEIRDILFDKEAFPPAAWEAEKQWTDTVNDLPANLKISDCYLHVPGGCPVSENLSEILDSEFQFFLWLSKPYVALLPDPEEKTIAACWIQLLCGVAYEKEACVELKEIRNDYMQALLGYVHDLRVEGPFRLMPPDGPLPPLALLYEDCQDMDNFADPAGNQAEEFLALQRLPESGAFAYINVTGELFGNF